MGGGSPGPKRALICLQPLRARRGAPRNVKGGRETSQRAPRWPKSAPREPKTAHERFKLVPT
eukprot:4245762-Pyramimonas_sp.AAC.1